MPTESSGACETEIQNASTVWPDRVRPRAVGDGDRGHHRPADAALVERPLDREQRGLGVQRVEDRLDQQEVDAAVEQPERLLAVGGLELVEGDGARAGVVDVARQRGGLVRRPERAGHEAGAARLRRHRRVGRRARGPRRGDVDLADERLECRSRPARSRCALNVLVSTMSAPAVEVRAVRRLDDVGPGEVQQLVVALDVARRGPRSRSPR